MQLRWTEELQVLLKSLEPQTEFIMGPSYGSLLMDFDTHA